jgi:hypothetical protein
MGVPAGKVLTDIPQITPKFVEIVRPSPPA